MADNFESVIKNFSGLSTETKPTIAAGNSVTNGSRWREVDTEKVWFFNLDDDAWYLAGPRIDAVTHALETIDYAHHEVHAGSHYFMDGYATLASTNDQLRVKLVTPNTTKWAHFTWDISSSGILTTEFYEGASGGMGSGAAVTPMNSNRNSTNTSVMTIESAVDTATSDGTLISKAKWGSTGKFSGSGGSHGRESEIILKQDTTYLRKFITGADANIVQFRASWYEHTSKT